MTDEQLVEEFRSDNQESFEKIVEKYLKPIYNFVFQLTRETGASEDITQDVFVKMWQNLESFEAERKFSTWLYAIAKNTALDWLKKKKALPFSFFESGDNTNFLDYIEDDASLSSDEILKNIDMRADALDLLENLSLQKRAILLLHHAQGFSLIEISSIMGQSPNTVKSQYRRALLQLREITSDSKSRLFRAPKIMPSIENI